MKLTNRSNRSIYRMWSPIYDGLFDRFFYPQARPQAMQMLNILTTLLGTDITRRFGDMVRDSRCAIVRDEPSLLRGAYRVIMVQPD
jgi:phosphatidylethanolamine/phosphatidyl-N-methylethanolamine N-methyltransferase